MSSNGDHSIREHHHLQVYQYRFQSETFAPRKGGSGRPCFTVEPMVYISAVGWDVIDPMVSGNAMMIAFRNYVRMHELLGYEHLGLTSDEITQAMKNIWGKDV